MSDKEKPNYDFDALPYGSADGLRSTVDIYILICYVVVNSKERLSDDVLVKTMVEGEFANYFETTNALQKIKEKGLFTVNEQGFLKPANNCEYFVELVENELPYTMRKRAVELAAKLAVKELYRQENEVEVIKNDDDYTVTMHFRDCGKNFMVLSLTVPTSAQAEMFKEQFYADPVKIYNNLIDSLFSDESNNKE